MRDSTSLDRLVLENLPAALRFATRMTGDADRAEDIVQEALVRVVRAWPDFHGESAFRTWLFRIVINVFRDQLRKASPALAEHEACGEAIDSAAVDPVDAASAVELEQRVAAEVSRLPPRQREVLVLSVYEGLSTRDIAQAVGISEANVYSTLYAARAQLKSRLAAHLKSIGK